MDMEKVMTALRAMPVAINCYYGDPTLQWADTIEKLQSLANSGHTGPVSVITKGSIGPERAKQLAELKLPGLIVMVSISELPRGFEGIGHEHRYQALENCREAGVKSFAAVRPLTPPHNTNVEVITRIFQRLQSVGCETACVSGFRGNEDLINAMNPNSGIEWVLRVKQMTGMDIVLQVAKENGVRVFTRIACTVAHLTGRDGTMNPYWGSPQLVRCNEIGCPMIDTCGPVESDEDVLNWLRELGYDLEYQPSQRMKCGYSSDTRLNCQSCCTTCFVQRQPRVMVYNAETLGDLTFCRFVLGGTLCVKPNMIDGGSKDVAHVKIVQDQLSIPVHCINSWWAWANQLDKCFGCKYCVSGLYPNKGPVGCNPIDLLDLLNKSGCKKNEK